jgi:hypothetical protein
MKGEKEANSIRNGGHTDSNWRCSHHNDHALHTQDRLLLLLLNDGPVLVLYI